MLRSDDGSAGPFCASPTSDNNISEAGDEIRKSSLWSDSCEGNCAGRELKRSRIACFLDAPTLDLLLRQFLEKSYFFLDKINNNIHTKITSSLCGFKTYEALQMGIFKKLKFCCFGNVSK